jgi:hypothetical protein
VAFETQAAIEGGSDIARLQGTGKDAGSSGVHDLEGDIANGGHASNPLRLGSAPDRCVPKQIDMNSEIISKLILRRKGLTCRTLGHYGILATL